MPLKTTNEVTIIAECINTLTAKLRGILLDLRDTCGKFSEISNNLEEAGSEIGGNSAAIRASIKDAGKTMDELVTSFNAVAAKLRDLSAESERGSTTVYEMSQVNQEVFDNVTAMSSAVTQSIAAIEEMTGAIEKTSGHVSRLNNDIESVNSAMQRLDSSIAIEEKSAGDSIATAEELSENAESGMRALKETINGISKIEESSAETAEVIAALGKHAMNIGNILHVIDDVTKQTNLLALNAAIISAQAGEHGRGFAVVAEEIGALAGRTKDSTKEIAELITTIQAETERAVKVMGESKGVIAAGAKLGKEAQEAFDKLKKSADKSIEQAKALAKATAEQASDVRAVTGAIESITGTVGEINSSAQNQAQGAAALNKAAEKMNLLNQQVAKSSEEQARSAKDVLKAIQNISEMSALVNKRQESQIAATKEAAGAVEFVDKNAVMQNRAADKLGNIIATINEQLKELTVFTEEFKI
jgi:methyl-accepting chemotaxis protein